MLGEPSSPLSGAANPGGRNPNGSGADWIGGAAVAVTSWAAPPPLMWTAVRVPAKPSAGTLTSTPTLTRLPDPTLSAIVQVTWRPGASIRQFPLAEPGVELIAEAAIGSSAAGSSISTTLAPDVGPAPTLVATAKKREVVSGPKAAGEAVRPSDQAAAGAGVAAGGATVRPG